MELADHLDQLLDQPTAGRADWLAALARREPELAQRLSRLWQGLREADAAGFLQTPAHLVDEAPEPASLTDGQRIGPWRLLRRLGRGGMAEVWLAERALGDYERQVALKLARASDGQAQRFERERDVMASLTHPCIARLYDAGVSDGQAWIAMEYVEGEPLLAAAGRLSLRQRVEVLVRLADAVQHAHAGLVVHRDIKPGNVLLDADGRPRLLDFGIARLLDGSADLTRHGASPLTLEFAAPEQLRGERVGVACDVYALGLLGVVMLTGVSPFAGARDDTRSLMAAILQGRIARPSALVAAPGVARALRGDLDAILLRATAPEPEARYASAQAFGDDLLRYLGGEPVRARPARLAYVAGRWLKRHRWAAGAAALAVLSLTGAAAWALHSARSQALAAQRAEAQYDFFRRLLVHDESEMSDVAHRDERVQDLLRAAAVALPGALKEAPEARYQLMRDLAPMLDGLGEGDEAIRLLQAQRQQAQSSHGPRSVEAAKPLLMLAQLQCEARQDLACAHRLVHEAWSDFKHAGFDDPNWLAGAEAMVGYYGWLAEGRLQPEHLAHVEHAATLLRAHPETRSLANDALALLSDMYLADGRPEAALAAAREGVAFNLRWLGRDNWHTGELMTRASTAARMAGLLDEALLLQQQGLEIQDKVWPRGHPFQVRDRVALARLLALGSDQARAGRLLAEAGERMAGSGSSYGQRQQQRWQQAQTEFDVLQGRLMAGTPGACEEQALPVERALRASWWQRCAQQALLAGRLGEADALLQHAESQVKPQEASFAHLALRRAQWLAARGQGAEAVGRLQSLLAQRQPHDALLRAQAWFSLAELAPRELDLAALQQERAGMSSLNAEAQAWLDEAWGRSLWARGQADAARQLLGRALAWRDAQPGQAAGLWRARLTRALADARTGQAGVEALELRARALQQGWVDRLAPAQLAGWRLPAAGLAPVHPVRQVRGEHAVSSRDGGASLGS